MTKQMICPECKKTVDFEASNCPHCGIAITDEIRKKAKKQIFQGSIIILTLVAAIIFGGYLFFSGGDEEKIILPGTPLDYWVVEQELITTKDKKGYFRETYYLEIATMNITDNATQADLISTAMQAALDYHKKISAPIINVRFQATGESKLFTPTLAFISYVPDKKGIDGYTDSSPIWLNARACPRGFTQDEKNYIRLYEKLAPYYLDEKTLTISEENKKKLKAKIEQELGMQFDIDPLTNILQNVTLSK